MNSAFDLLNKKSHADTMRVRIGLSSDSQAAVAEKSNVRSPNNHGAALGINSGPALSGSQKQPVAKSVMPKVAILLCTHQGQDYLNEQLDSIGCQTHTNWQVWASDDDSADDTRVILDAYKQTWRAGQLSIQDGPVAGFAANFLSLTCKADIDADYFAFADQDDIWDPDKLERAVAWLDTIAAHTPALYCSRTRLVDAQNKEIGLSPLFSKPPGFGNSLVQNIGGGNTMVFNNAARALLREAGEDVPVVAHDWWVYMVIVGCGGKVLYDPYPSLRYRQHHDNLVGANASWLSRLVRMRMLWRGRFRNWIDRNIQALGPLHNRLTPENQDILERFAKAREMRLIPRLFQLKRIGIYRQSMLGNLGLIAAAVLRKI